MTKEEWEKLSKDEQAAWSVSRLNKSGPTNVVEHFWKDGTATEAGRQELLRQSKIIDDIIEQWKEEDREYWSEFDKRVFFKLQNATWAELKALPFYERWMIAVSNPSEFSPGARYSLFQESERAAYFEQFDWEMLKAIGHFGLNTVIGVFTDKGLGKLVRSLPATVRLGDETASVVGNKGDDVARGLKTSNTPPVTKPASKNPDSVKDLTSGKLKKEQGPARVMKEDTFPHIAEAAGWKTKGKGYFYKEGENGILEVEIFVNKWATHPKTGERLVNTVTGKKMIPDLVIIRRTPGQEGIYVIDHVWKGNKSHLEKTKGYLESLEKAYGLPVKQAYDFDFAKLKKSIDPRTDVQR